MQLHCPKCKRWVDHKTMEIIEAPNGDFMQCKKCEWREAPELA